MFGFTCDATLLLCVVSVDVRASFYAWKKVKQAKVKTKVLLPVGSSRLFFAGFKCLLLRTLKQTNKKILETWSETFHRNMFTATMVAILFQVAGGCVVFFSCVGISCIVGVNVGNKKIFRITIRFSNNRTGLFSLPWGLQVDLSPEDETTGFWGWHLLPESQGLDFDVAQPGEYSMVNYWAILKARKIS